MNEIPNNNKNKLQLHSLAYVRHTHTLMPSKKGKPKDIFHIIHCMEFKIGKTKQVIKPYRHMLETE